MIMTPQHPLWNEFCGRLDKALEGSPAGCFPHCGDRVGKPSHQSARAILANMGMDIQASLEFFEEHGGNCDCEILLNVEDSNPEEKSEE